MSGYIGNCPVKVPWQPIGKSELTSAGCCTKSEVAVFLKDTEKYYDEVETQALNHQTVFCIVYLTKIQKRIFF